jgi:hypothetical protein
MRVVFFGIVASESFGRTQWANHDDLRIPGFETFGASVLTLFGLLTGEQFNDIVYAWLDPDVYLTS